MTDARYRMAVDGMTCDACNDHVEGALREAGARDVRADWRRREAVFTGDRDTDTDVLADAVRRTGYRPRGVEAIEAAGPAPSTGRDGEYDLLILGAGSAAFAAAIRARDAGARVAMVEAATVGGTCVNVGCVPSKAALRAAEVRHLAGTQDFAGITTRAEAPDLPALIAQKDELVDTMRQEKYIDLVNAYGWEYLRGAAAFSGPDTVSVDGREIRAGAVLVATGASPALPPIEGLAEIDYLTSATALELTELPGRLAVIGANAIGLEMGQYFAHLGSQVTFLDIADRIAPFEEPEVSEAMTGVLRVEGSEVHAPAQITRVEPSGSGYAVHADVGGREVVVPCDRVLVATGRRPNTGELRAGAAGIDLDGGGAVLVDEGLRTSNPKVFAAGDCTPAPQFVYVSAYEGALAADNALGASRSVDFRGLPRVTFTSPQIASAGMTEAEARDAGHEVKTSMLPLSAVPRAIVNRDTRGLIKLVADERTDELLGASILSENAGDVVQSAVLAVRFRLTTRDLAETFHPYLTIAEGLKLAAQAFTRDVAKLSCCAA